MGFDELWGNDLIKISLKKAIDSGHISNSYVFEGISGVGKRLCSDIFARALVCESKDSKPCDTCSACIKAKSKNHPDIIRITRTPGKSSVGVGDVREQILSEIYLKPYLANRRIILVENGDDLSVEAQNALLKVLEEPPENVTFVICVTRQDRLLDTVLSRSCVMTFFPLPESTVKNYLTDKFANDEKIIFSSALSQGSIGAAMTFMTDDTTENLFTETIKHLCNLKLNAVKMRETVDFFIEKKESINEVTDFMLTFLRDCVFVKSDICDCVIYKNKISDMRVFADNIDKKALVSAFDRLIDFKLRLKQNLNFNASVSETVMRVWEDFHDEGSGYQV